MSEQLQIDRIHHNGDTQIRVQLDWIAVDEYMRAMQDGATFPPVDVFFDDELYWLADGFHRIEAATRIGRETIEATVREGGKSEAIVYALQINQRYGVRLTTRDKRRGVEMVLDDPKLRQESDSEIARLCGVTHPTVASIRQSILKNLQDEKPAKRKVRRNGKTYTMDTSNIGKGEVEPESGPSLFDEDVMDEVTMPTEPVVDLDILCPRCGSGAFDSGGQGDMEYLICRDCGWSLWQEFDASGQVIFENTGLSAAIIEVDGEDTEADPPEVPVVLLNRDSSFVSEYVDAESVHLVITSPPYNVGLDYDTIGDDLNTYLPWLTSIWQECFKVMVEGARIAVVVPFGVGRNPYVPFAGKVMQTLAEAGFNLRGQIVWDKGTAGNRTSWGSFRMESSPALRDTTECIIVAHKGSGRLTIPPEQILRDAKGTYTRWLEDADYFMELAQDHWQIGPESALRAKHPAPFPPELVRRLLHFYGYPGCHVLDPFGGSGTVGVVAKVLGCQATLFEISQSYSQRAEERIRG